MTNYYFLSASLPELFLGKKSDLTFGELMKLIQMNVKGKDLKKVVVFRRWIDLYNIRAHLLKHPIDPHGNLNEKELEQALLIQDELPAYVFDVLNQFETVPEQIRFFPAVLSAYFREEISQQDGFLKKYLEFEQQFRLVLLAIKSKELGRDLGKELQFEDLQDPFVMMILAQKDLSSYEPPVEFLPFKEKYLSCGQDPWQQFKQTSIWKFQKIEELVQEPLFSIDWILAYMARLTIVEEYYALDPTLDRARGEVLLETLIG